MVEIINSRSWWSLSSQREAEWEIFRLFSFSRSARERDIDQERGRRVVIEICMAARADGVLVFHFLAHPIEQLLFVFRRHRIHYKPNYRQTQSSQTSTRPPENGGGAKFHIWLTRSPEKW